MGIKEGFFREIIGYIRLVFVYYFRRLKSRFKTSNLLSVVAECRCFWRIEVIQMTVEYIKTKEAHLG